MGGQARSMEWWMGLGGAGESHAGEGLVREDSLETDTWAEKAPPDLDLDGIPG